MTSVAQLLFERMAQYGQLVALVCSGRSFSYSDLSERACSVAAALIDCGAEKETIGIVGQRSPSSYFGILGILFAGCSYVPINPKYNQQRLVSVLRDANVRFLIGDRGSLETLELILSASGSPIIQSFILPEGVSPKGKKWIDENSLQQTSPIKYPLSSSAQDLAYILYTSGSTGVPKGVQVVNSNVMAFLNSMESIYKLDIGFRASQFFDFSFDPSVSDMFFTWAHAGTLCVVPEEELMLPDEFISREKITFWNSVPTVAGFLHKMGRLSPGVFPELTHSMFCGEQFPKYLADIWKQAAPNSTVENLYGPTETTIYISRHVYGKSEENKNFRNSIIPIGQPFVNHEVALIGEDRRQVSKGESGEIVFKGPQVTKGYLNGPSKTASSFMKLDWDASGEKWYRTGDLGFYNEKGNLECTGRMDSQLKLGGRRIETGEIEAILNCYPQTKDAVVIPLYDKNIVVIGLVAFIRNKLSKDEENVIRKDSEKYLDRIFFPKKIITIESFPLAQSGKIDRKALAVIANE